MKSRFIQMPWVQWAYDEKILKEEEHQQMLLIMGKKVVGIDNNKEASEDELANRLRLIGALAAMLQDKSIPVDDKKSATAIATYIGKNYAPGLENKGLAEGTVRKVLGKAKKQLEDDGIKG